MHLKQGGFWDSYLHVVFALMAIASAFESVMNQNIPSQDRELLLYLGYLNLLPPRFLATHLLTTQSRNENIRLGCSCTIWTGD